METIELREAFKALPPLQSRRGDSWRTHRRSIRRHVERQDPLRFLNWSTITATMFVGNAPYIKHEFEVLKHSGEWDRWRHAVQETYLGAPVNLPYYTATSGNLIHQAYHLQTFEGLSGKSLTGMNSIYEFGCGYGAMALVASRAGFFGDYHVHDFPELLLLTVYYLGNLGVDNIHFEDRIQPLNVDLLIACFSLSEVRTGLRREVLEKVHADNYLFAFQGHWDGVHNYDYFDSFSLMRDDLRWECERVTHMPVENNAIWYMVGSRR